MVILVLGAGFTLSWGCAQDVVDIIEKL